MQRLHGGHLYLWAMCAPPCPGFQPWENRAWWWSRFKEPPRKPFLECIGPSLQCSNSGCTATLPSQKLRGRGLHVAKYESNDRILYDNKHRQQLKSVAVGRRFNKRFRPRHVLRDTKIFGAIRALSFTLLPSHSTVSEILDFTFGFGHDSGQIGAGSYTSSSGQQ